MDSAESLKQQIANLTPAQRALLEQRLRAKKSEAASPARAVPRREERRSAPLSFAQQRLWFLDQLAPGSPSYNITRAYVVRGALDRDVLRRAVDAIVSRHEALRTTFATVDDQATQHVEPAQPTELAFADLTGFAEHERQKRTEELIAVEARRPFDLSRGPFLRVSLIRRAEREHVLVLAMHHIVSDGWSMGIFVRELAAFYEGFSQGTPAELPELPVQYADFARWQREWLQGEVLERQLSYWKRQLAAVPVLELPTDRPRPPAQSFRGGRRSVSFPKELLAGLKELSRREGATLYMTLLAAFNAMLSRYTGQEDIVVGSPIAGRNRSEIEGLIGFFVNTLVLRTDLSGEPSFRELVRRVREVALGAYAHQDVPFEKLVEELQPARDLGQNPLFQVSFALQNAPAGAFGLAGLKTVSIPVESGAARFDLEVHLWESADTLNCTVIYATDLFDPETIVRMIGHYRTLLESIVADPGRSVWSLPMLSESERRRVLVEFNPVETPYPREKTVHGLFEESVDLRPDSEAVVSAADRVTYRELNERANRMARYLKRRGVGRDVVVGSCTERSVEMVVGLLGVLKAGGAYLPLDPSYPRQRLGFMLEETKAPLVLTQASLFPALPEGSFERVCLDADWDRIEEEDAENPRELASPEDLAYVIYTSGSTGKPKGVAVSHRSVVNLIAWHTQTYGVGPADRATLLASPAFDASVWELWPYLAAGASLRVPSEEVRLDLGRLRRWLESEGITICFLPTPLAQALLAESEPLRGRLRYLLTGGDRLRRPPVRSYGFQLVNHYGPTEATVVATAGTVDTEEETNRHPSIGRPIQNTRVYLLDPRGQPVPPGVPGEIYVGGAGVAREYLHRPDLTAERFLPDPLGSDGERMYRTGDQARYRSDGTIEFLGRLDHQVKVRGYRIEVGEVEEALARHPDVEACVVSAIPEGSGENRLVAYVVSREGMAAAVNSLRGFLKTILPDYMIPSAFVFLDALPLTPNGKVDRRALPVPDSTRPELEDVFVPPRNPVEQTVAGIWSQVLGLEKVGVHDNFFELGGHSLLATLVFARLQKAFPLPFTLRAVFEKPTVAELSAAIEEVRGGRADSRPSPILPVSRQALSRGEPALAEGRSEPPPAPRSR